MCCTTRKLVAQQVHNSGGGVGEHRRQEQYQFRSSKKPEPKNHRTIRCFAKKKKNLTNSSYI
jgi:hypothetical protein